MKFAAIGGTELACCASLFALTAERDQGVRHTSTAGVWNGLRLNVTGEGKMDGVTAQIGMLLQLLRKKIVCPRTGVMHNVSLSSVSSFLWHLHYICSPAMLLVSIILLSQLCLLVSTTLSWLTVPSCAGRLQAHCYRQLPSETVLTALCVCV